MLREGAGEWCGKAISAGRDGNQIIRTYNCLPLLCLTLPSLCPTSISLVKLFNSTAPGFQLVSIGFTNSSMRIFLTVCEIHQHIILTPLFAWIEYKSFPAETLLQTYCMRDWGTLQISTILICFLVRLYLYLSDCLFISVHTNNFLDMIFTT